MLSKIFHAEASLFLALPLSLFLVACAPDPVRVGVLLPLSGPDADLGQSQRVAVELAAEKINASGGIGGRRLELVVTDTQGDPAASLPLIEKLLRKSNLAALLSGSPSQETLLYARELERAHRVLLCSEATAPELSDAGEWIFRNCPSNALEAKVLADFAAFTLHATRVLVFTSDSAECDSLRSEFLRSFQTEGRTGETTVLPVSRKETDEALLKALRRRPSPHAVLLALEGGQLASVARALRKAGLAAPILATNRADSGAVLSDAGPAAEAIVFAVPGWNPFSPEPRVREFLSDYQTRARQEPTLAAAQAYDGIFLLARAMNDRGPEPEEVRRGLVELREVQGVAGTTTFDAKGDVLRSYEMWVVHQGRPVPLQRVQDAVLPGLQQQVGAARFGSQ